MDLKNRVALVTGASGDIGGAIARCLAENGAQVILTYVGAAETAAKLETEIGQAGGNAWAVQLDQRDPEAIEAVMAQVEEKYARLDILVNNAGNNRPEHFTKVKKENMEYLTNLNMKAAFNVAQLCSQKMVKAKNRKKIGGSIIHMSSQLGKVGCEGRNVYNMNKFGVEGLARGMAVELAEYNIRVNTVCPTFVETPMVKKFFKNKKFKNEMLKNIPLGRVAKESDVATAVAFLAADSSEMITGTSLVVDGGWTAK